MLDLIGLSTPLIIGAILVLAGVVTAAALGKISRSTLTLLLILILGAVLRLRWIDQPYFDLFSWRQSSVAMIAENYYKTNPNILYPEVNWSGPGPNYQGREFQTVSYLAAILYRFLGQQDWIGRLIAVAFGVWGIFALYKLVCLSWNKNLALLSAALMAILPASVFIERSFLPDPAMVALMTTSLWLFVLYLTNDRLLMLLFAALTGALGALTKIPGLILGLPALYALIRLLPKKSHVARRLFTISLAGLMILIVVTLYYSWARHLSLSYPPYHFAGGGNWIWASSLHGWLGEYYFIKGLIKVAVNWLWTLPILLLTLTGFGFLFVSWLDEQRTMDLVEGLRLPWLFSWWLIASGIYYLLGAQELVMNPWNLHIVTPAIAALSALALSLIFQFVQRGLGRPAAAAVVAAIFLLVVVIAQSQNFNILYKGWAYEDYLMGLALRQMTEPDDLVVTINNDLGDPSAIYYSRRRGWIYPPPTPGVWDDLLQDEDASISELSRLQREGAQWLGIVARHRRKFWQKYPRLAAYIERTTTVVEEHDEYVILRFND